jgi:dynein heavy chain
MRPPLLPPFQFLDFFFKGNLSLERHPRPRPHDWLPDQGWQDVMALTELAETKKAVGGE